MDHFKIGDRVEIDCTCCDTNPVGAVMELDPERQMALIDIEIDDENRYLTEESWESYDYLTIIPEDSTT